VRSTTSRQSDFGTPRAPAASATTVEDKLATAPRLSIAVLPFENLSGDKGQDYFADGITDDLTTDLSHLPDSFVIARNTAFTYKGKPVVKDAGTAAEALEPRGGKGRAGPDARALAGLINVLKRPLPPCADR